MDRNRESEEPFEKYLEEAEKASFSGWDFGYLTHTRRMVEAPLKWNYFNVVLPYIMNAESLLDMGTGGGEVLSAFSPLPSTTFATEQYKPNVEVARKKLGPLGVKVFEIEEEDSPPYNTDLPFEDDFFDLIINRHEAYYPPELYRILKSGGIFITQQVGGNTNRNLIEFLTGEPPRYSRWNLESAAAELEAAGFSIVQQQEDTQFYRFYDIGAIFYLLKAIPWTIEDFSVERYRVKLRELHLKINADGYYDTPQHRFIIVARKA